MNSVAPQIWQHRLKLEPLDILIAHKTINLSSDLSGAEKRVAGAIIDHFNRKSGQCDPSIERIAKLLNLSQRTVIRATNRLAQIGLVVKYRHQGHFNRNSYVPNWFFLRQLDANWSRSFTSAKRARENPNLSPQTCQSCQVNDDSSVRQTFSTNSLNLSSTVKDTKFRARSRATKSVSNDLAGNKGGVESAIMEAARAAAERRWNSALFSVYGPVPDVYAAIVDAIDLAMQIEATGAELRKRGSGLTCLVDALRRRGVAVESNILPEHLPK